MLRRARKLVSPAPVIKITFRAHARPQGENRLRAERRAGRGRLRSAQDAARGAARGSRPHGHEARVRIGRMRTCTVLLDGAPVLSCLVLGLACEGRRVKTVEGLAQGSRLHPLQEAFAALGAAQCGYCTPAFLLTADALLADNPSPNRDDIKQALSGNL